MALQEQLLSDMQAAMRSGDKTRVSTLRYLRSACGYAAVEKLHSLSDVEVLEVIDKQVKQRKDSIQQFELGKRVDLVAQEQAELAILLEYLPKQMGREELVATAREVILKVGATSPKQMGMVMQALMPTVKGKADGSLISEVVRQLLSDARSA